VAGGLNGGGLDGSRSVGIADAEIYDPVAQVWTTTGSLPGAL